MLKQIQQLQTRMARMQEELGTMTVTGTAGGGAVTVVATGHQQIQSIAIQPEVLEEGAEMVSDLVLAAVNAALAARVDGNGPAPRPRQRLEGRLGQVVVVPPGAAHVQRAAGGPGERLEGVLDQLGRQGADALAPEGQVHDRVGATADVHDGGGDGLIHRHCCVAGVVAA